MSRAHVSSLLLALLCGCQTLTVEHRAPELRLRAPLRVAVLPFADRADGDFGLAVPLGAMMDIVPLMSDDAYDRANGAKIFRDKLIANLRLAPLEVLPPQVVDAQLAALAPPLTAVQASDRQSVAQRVGSELGVDLVVFGEVSEWDRNYVLLASWVSAGLAVEVRDGRSGELLFGGEVSDTETAGLHKGMIATEPVEVLVIVVGEGLRGLRNTLFTTLTDDICRALVGELRGASPPDDEELPAPPPRIEHVAATHDDDEVFVVLLGTPDQQGTLRVPGGEPVALVESRPGVYHGVLWFPSGRPTPERIELELTDRDLQRAVAGVRPHAR